MTLAALHPYVDRIHAAQANGTTLSIRGGGTKDFYGEVRHGALLESRDLAGIVSYEPSELVVTARTGTPLAELEAILAEHDQCLPFEPPHFDHSTGSDTRLSTVGGMVAAGLAGPARPSAGSVRDYVLGAQLIDGRGQVLDFGGTVMKNVAGYDVSRVLAGSLGTLGFITQVSLKVLPQSRGEATLRFDCSQADALRLLNGWGGQPLPLNASWWTGQARQLGGTLWLRLRGAVAAVEAACTRLGGERIDPTTANADWRACRNQTLPFFAEQGQQDLWRLSVPQVAPVLSLPGTPLIEWHGALRWYMAPVDAALQMRKAAREAGGHATLFRASAAYPDRHRFDAVSPALAAIHQALKREFDPAGVFNRDLLLYGHP